MKTFQIPTSSLDDLLGDWWDCAETDMLNDAMHDHLE